MNIYLKIIVACICIGLIHPSSAQCYTVIYKSETKFPEFAYAYFKDQIPYSIGKLQTDEKFSEYKTIGFVPESGFSLLNLHYFKNKVSHYSCTADLSYPDSLGTMFPSMTTEAWDIQDKTEMINGISCRKALLKNSDQIIEAYYAIEIPINDGPYLYCNLPGLIVRIEDPTQKVTLTEIKYDKNCVVQKPEDFGIKYIDPQKWDEYKERTKNYFPNKD